MSDETTVKLFSIVLTAWRIENDQPQVAMRNMIAFSAGEVDLEQEGNKAVLDLFPIADNWRDHNVFWTEIPQGMMLGALKLTWSVEEQADTKNEGAEK